MALDAAPLTWFENLPPRSIDCWDRLRRMFIDNFQGTFNGPKTRHDLSMCKQKSDESLREYMRRFFEIRSAVADISDRDVIELFHQGITNRFFDSQFGMNRPRTVSALRSMIEDWADQEDREKEKYGARRNNEKQNNNANRGNDFKGKQEFKKRRPDDTVAVLDKNPKTQKRSNISATPHLKSTTSGYPSVGSLVKHRHRISTTV
ncbi:unnamed protein product [Urochloa humidicola]